MFKLSKILPLQHLRTLYFTIVYCHIVYCIIIWGKSVSCNINRIKSAQKRAIKLFTVPNCNIFEYNNLLSVDCMYSYFTLLKFYKALYLDNHNYIKNKIISLIPSHNYNTRVVNQASFNVPYYRKAIVHHFFMYNSIKLYNALLPSFKVNNITFNQLKKKIKESFDMYFFAKSVF